MNSRRANAIAYNRRPSACPCLQDSNSAPTPAATADAQQRAPSARRSAQSGDDGRSAARAASWRRCRPRSSGAGRSSTSLRNPRSRRICRTARSRRGSWTIRRARCSSGRQRLRKALQPLLAEHPAEIAIAVYGTPAERRGEAKLALYVAWVNGAQMPLRKKKNESPPLARIRLFGHREQDAFADVRAKARRQRSLP